MTTANPVSSAQTSRPFMNRVKKTLFVFVGIVVLIAALTVTFLMYANYGDGYRVGTILKVARKGVIFKTWEGELSQGFLDSAPDTGGVATRVWYFTVNNEDKDVMTALDHAIETNKKVKIYYKEKYTTLPWIGDTRQVAYKVEEVQ